MIDPVPGNEPVPPSPLDGLSKQELKSAALVWLGKAKDMHQDARMWRHRALLAEARLAVLEGEKGIGDIINVPREVGTTKSKEKL